MRTHINPSSIGSYFGVGFNTPEEQFQIDLGEIEQEFDEDAKKRLRLGNMLEDGALNYFEETLGVIIDNRNTEKVYLYDGKIVGKMDGTCLLNDIKTCVENKISNSKNYKFTENLGYLMQCQCYMIDGDFEQTLLCGLLEGKPIFKIIPRDVEMINDIKEMTDFVVDCLLGLKDFEKEFPNHLYEKYAKSKPLVAIDNLNERGEMLVAKLAELKEKAKEFKEVEDMIKAIEDELKNDYELGCINKDNYKITLSNNSRKGSLDEDALLFAFPDVDLEKYRKPLITYKTLKFSFKKDK